MRDEGVTGRGVGLRLIVDLEADKPTARIAKAIRLLNALGCSVEIAPPPGGAAATTRPLLATLENEKVARPAWPRRMGVTILLTRLASGSAGQCAARAE